MCRSDAWVDEFQRASTGLSTNDEAKKSANAIFQVCSSYKISNKLTSTSAMRGAKSALAAAQHSSLNHLHIAGLAFLHACIHDQSSQQLQLRVSITAHSHNLNSFRYGGRQGSEGVRLVQGIGALESSAKSGSVEEAKKSFVTAVSALQTWAESAGIAASLKGL